MKYIFKLQIRCLWVGIFIGFQGLNGAHGQSPLVSAVNTMQPGKKQTSLVTVLKKFEKHYDVNFVYDPELVSTKYVSESGISFSKNFEESIRLLLDRVNLRHKKIEDKLFVIQAKGGSTAHASEAVPANNSESHQDIIIKGKVVDEKGEGLPFATVVVKGSNAGGLTDASGNFSFKFTESKAILVVSAIGYLRKETEIDAQLNILISLDLDVMNLEEVIVVGYTSEKKSDLTGSLVTISSKDIDKLQVSGIDQALQGKAAGVNITQSTGSPGEGTSINIRGVGSINDNSPLFIIDGVPTKDGFNIISPSDIETISILKDASSAAIYGARAANGVVVVTTKRGVKGEPRVNFNSYFGVQQHGKLIDMVNTEQYVELFNEAVRNDNAQISNPSLRRREIPAGLEMANTNWQKAIMQTGLMTNNQLSISGGSEKSRYLVSGTYFDQKGIILNSGFNRYTLKTSIESDVSKKIKIGTNLNVAFSDRDIIGSSGDGYGGNGGSVIRYALFRTSGIPVYGKDGDFTDLPEYPQYFGDGYNPVGLALKTKDNQKQYRAFGNVYGEYKILKNLRFKTDAGLDLNIINHKTYSENWGTNLRINSPSSLTNRYGVITTVNWNNTLTYSKVLNELHNMTVLVGTEAIKNIERSSSGTDKGFLDQVTNLEYLGLGSSLQKSVSESESRWALLSMFGRVTYAFNDRYLLTANVRRDGSSRFSPANRFGTFYSGSVGWNIDREEFMQKYSRTVSALKLRASIGQLGNQDIGNYPWASLVGSGFNYPFGNTQNLGYTIVSRGNANVRWESSTQFDVGLDAGLFNHKILFTADYYIKTTSDMLLPIPVPPSGGIASAPYVNVGSVQNKGLEMQLTYRNNIKQLKYDVSANASFLQNKVISLNETPIAGGRIDNNVFATLTEVGHTIGSFHMYQMEGIFQNDLQIFTHAYQGNNIKPGDVMYKDISGPDGVPDGIINQYDRTHVGSPIPTLTYGLTLNLQYRNFDFSAFVQGVAGNKIYYQVATDIEGFYRPFNITQRVYNNRWTGENTSNTQPRVSWIGSANNKLPSTRFLENGAYTRLKNLQLGYTFSDNVVKKLAMRSLRVYVGGQNLFTLTQYPGMDPEMGTSNNVNSEQFSGPVAVGIDWGTYPSAKTYVLGFNVNF